MHPALPWLLLAAPAALPLLFTTINALTWPRGRPGKQPEPDLRLSVLVPARNEAGNIEACVRAIFASDAPLLELLVFDDGSTDATPQILARLQGEYPLLRVIQGDGLPAGWVGKPHACHRLSQEARGDLLLHLDADVVLAPDGLSRLLDLAARPIAGRRPDLVTAVPRQVMGSAAERLMMPVLHLTYSSWLPLILIPRVADGRVLAANGQVLLVRRAALQAAGGWAAVRHEIVDDMAMCRRVKEQGGCVLFADGHRIAACRMYDSGPALWKGFSKNLYEGIGGSLTGLLGVLLLYGLSFVLPFLALPLAAALQAPTWAAAATAGIALNLLTRTILALRHAHAPWAVLLHPVAVLGLLGIAVNSRRWSQQGRIEWAGRTYAARAQRSAP